MLFKKEGPPALVTFYVGGRSHIITKEKNLRGVAQLGLFEKDLRSGKFDDVKPGRYHFNFTRVGFLRTEGELTPID